MNGLIDKVCEEFDLSEDEFVLLCSRAPRMYKRYHIPKRAGGYRTIAQPSKYLKSIQRWLTENYFQNLSVHPSAMAYVKGVNILNNAQAHIEGDFLYKFDFRNFFPSIKPRDFQAVISKNDIGIGSYEAELVSRLIFWDPPQGKGLELSVGAPSSPIISNAIMYDFDCKIAEFCKSLSLVYTRYADDICISGFEKVNVKEAGRFFKETVFELDSPKLAINTKKTIFINEKSPKKITGLAITPDRRISAGRKLKRKVKALIHQYELGKLSRKDIMRLKGYLDYLRDVEPEYVAKVNPEGSSIFK